MKQKLGALLLMTTVFFNPIAAQAEAVTITVKGMVCSFCAQGIKKSFGKNENVKDANVDLDQKVVKLEFKEGKSLKDEEIKGVINDAGFEVVNIDRGKGA